MEKATFTLKEFGTGQITLPKPFRRLTQTKHYLASQRGLSLIITPIREENILGVGEVDEQINEPGYTSILNAKKLGYPRGIPVKLVLQALRELREKEDGQDKKASRQTAAKKKRSR